MYGAEAFLFGILFSIIWFVVLYFVIREAVKSALWQSRNIGKGSDYRKIDYSEDYGSDGVRIAKTTCPSCRKRHDVDYPKCPHCGYVYQTL